MTGEQKHLKKKIIYGQLKNNKKTPLIFIKGVFFIKISLPLYSHGS